MYRIECYIAHHQKVCLQTTNVAGLLTPRVYVIVELHINHKHIQCALEDKHGIIQDSAQYTHSMLLKTSIV